MGKAKSVCDVFISHNSQEKVFTSEIAGVLRSYGLQVFVDSEIPADSKLDVAVWDAMAESQALVAIISDTEPSTWLAIEMGAAKAWHKPIYGIVSNPSRVRVPAAFHDMQLYPRSRIDEVAKEIKTIFGIDVERRNRHSDRFVPRDVSACRSTFDATASFTGAHEWIPVQRRTSGGN